MRDDQPEMRGTEVRELRAEVQLLEDALKIAVDGLLRINKQCYTGGIAAAVLEEIESVPR